MTIPNNEKLSIRTEAQEFLKLAVPLAGAQVAQLTTGFADTVMMGHLGNEILAAGGLASITFLHYDSYQWNRYGRYSFSGNCLWCRE